MLTKEDKSNLRSTIFKHIDGIATSTTAHTLQKKGVLDYLLKHNEVSLSDLVKEFKANEGYLNIALRIICSQGWLEQKLDNKTDSISYQINSNSDTAFKLVYLYEDAVQLLQYSRFALEVEG